MNNYNPEDSENLLICNACGTQFDTAGRNSLKTCFICDDPRQYVPPSGQSFTTLADLRAKHKNEFHPHHSDPRLISIVTTPKFAIGQRAILIQTPSGQNVMWDCLTLLDEGTVAEINKLGGLHAIVISHPHYYSTHAEWASAFNCPVYLSSEDMKWTARETERRLPIAETRTDIILGSSDTGLVETGVVAIKLGGHFPGSLVLLFDKHLLIADTLLTVPAGVANWKVNALGELRERPKGANTFSFMWSIPNFIPLSANEIVRMWGILKEYDFTSTHGAFVGTDIEDDDIKTRVLQSMQIQTKYMGFGEHPFLHALW
ncbi:metallo-beta-lactamase family protein [Lasiosphaeria hispida]|uniref:Metallo-beta-lactamase family protein n=1 Tax=Lasiosphaeria hispida TaxID=260671 RepID=A0AAJ0H640_9PEZI|nr:metallo-beta-lactamase family protein [Lasiosphaeria hispida]